MPTSWNEEHCKAVYEMLLQLPPFTRWKMPGSRSIEFVVNNDSTCYGEFEPPKIIRISKKKVGHLDTLIKTMAHEMLHLRLWYIKDAGWNKHDGKFEEYGERIAKSMGFDPKEF
jgi:hypothetical protein